MYHKAADSRSALFLPDKCDMLSVCDCVVPPRDEVVPQSLISSHFFPSHVRVYTASLRAEVQDREVEHFAPRVEFGVK